MNPGWYAHPDVTDTRLRALFPFIRGVTHEVDETLQPHKGDGRLTFGIMRYERTVRRLLDAEGFVESLQVRYENNECILHFGGSPAIKFCYDDPSQPRPSRTIPSPRELREKPTFFGIDENFAAVPLNTPKAVLRLFIDDDTLSICLFQPDGIALLDMYTVRPDEVGADVTTINAVGAELDMPVDLDAVEPDIDDTDAAASHETEAN